MQRQLPETHLAQMIAWIWLGILVVGVVAWFAYRYWRRRHPLLLPPPERSYGQCLQQRLAKSQAAKLRRRSGTAKSRRH